MPCQLSNFCLPINSTVQDGQERPFSWSLYPQGLKVTVPLMNTRSFTEDYTPSSPLQHISPRVQLHYFETVTTKRNSIPTPYPSAQLQACLSHSLKAQFHWHFAPSASWRVPCNSQHNNLQCFPKISRNGCCYCRAYCHTIFISTCICNLAGVEKRPIGAIP